MINRVVLVGRLTKDVEVRKTQQQTSVASFTIACNRRVSKGQDAQTDFINCVAWRATADFLGQYARKGALVGVEGRIQTRNYDGQDGKKVYVTEVVVDSAQLLESKAVSEARNSSSYDTNQANTGYFADNSYSDEDYSSGPSLDISTDDLPF